MPYECSTWTCNDARSELNCETRRGECEGFLICSDGIQIFLEDLSSNQQAPTHADMYMMTLIDCDEQTTKWWEKEKRIQKTRVVHRSFGNFVYSFWCINSVQSLVIIYRLLKENNCSNFKCWYISNAK